MSGSPSSSEDESSGGNASDEVSGEESGSESESSSSSGSGDDSDSSSDGDSGSSSDSGSGSSSGDDDDDGTSSGSGGEDSGGSEEEEEERDTEEKRLARKREDFEKMKEISAHMDNIVQRLSVFFPRDGKESDDDASAKDPPAAPELPALPLPPPNKAEGRSASARIMTMDRAVSAWRLTTDRAVSVASGMHFDDELSASTASNIRYEDQQDTGSRRAAGHGQGVASRRQSATEVDWAKRGRTGSERRVGTRDQREDDDKRAAQGRRESWRGSERNTNSANAGLGTKREPGGERGESRNYHDHPAVELEVEGSQERLLWDDLRESLEGAAGGERIPARRTWQRGVAVERTKAEKDRERRRRRLIDEAIAVLLEGSSSGGSSSDDEGLGDGAL